MCIVFEKCFVDNHTSWNVIVISNHFDHKQDSCLGGLQIVIVISYHLSLKHDSCLGGCGPTHYDKPQIDAFRKRVPHEQHVDAPTLSLIITDITAYLHIFSYKSNLQGRKNGRDRAHGGKRDKDKHHKSAPLNRNKRNRLRMHSLRLLRSKGIKRTINTDPEINHKASL